MVSQSLECLNNQFIIFCISFSIKRVNLYYFACHLVIFGKDSPITLKSSLKFINFIEFRQDFCPSIRQSFLIRISLIHFSINFNDPLSIEPQPIIEAISVANWRLIQQIHVMESKLRQLWQLSQIFNFGVETTLLLRPNNLFLIIRAQDNCREVVTIMRPSKSVKDTIVRIVNDEILWILRELRLQCLEQCCTQSTFSIHLEVCPVPAEHLHTVLRVASYVFGVHGPYGLYEIGKMKCGSFFGDNLCGSFDVFFLEIACYFCLEQ